MPNQRRDASSFTSYRINLKNFQVVVSATFFTFFNQILICFCGTDQATRAYDKVTWDVLSVMADVILVDLLSRLRINIRLRDIDKGHFMTTLGVGGQMGRSISLINVLLALAKCTRTSH